MDFQQRAPYVESLQREAISTDTFTAKFPRVDSCDFLLVRSLSVCDLDTAQKTADVGLMYNNLALWVQTISLTAEATFYKMSGTMVVPRDYQIVIRLNSPTKGDKLYANATGEYISYGK